MWVVVIIALNALASPDVKVRREVIYPTEEACKADIAKNVPARLEAKIKAAVEEGYTRYVCVRVPAAEAPKTPARPALPEVPKAK